MRLDRSSALEDQTWLLPAEVGTIQGWAFAHWGGRFYVFVTPQDPVDGTLNSKLLRLDPNTGETTLILEHLPYLIVGAGVSTCAPVELD